MHCVLLVSCCSSKGLQVWGTKQTGSFCSSFRRSGLVLSASASVSAPRSVGVRLMRGDGLQQLWRGDRTRLLGFATINRSEQKNQSGVDA